MTSGINCRARIQDVVKRREEIGHSLIRIRNRHRRRDGPRQRIVVIDLGHSLLIRSDNVLRHVISVISLLHKMHFILAVSLYLVFVIGTVDCWIV